MAIVKYTVSVPYIEKPSNFIRYRNFHFRGNFAAFFQSLQLQLYYVEGKVNGMKDRYICVKTELTIDRSFYHIDSNKLKFEPKIVP